MKQGEIKDRSKAPADEQKICRGCGLCCDGTLFLRAHLDRNERGRLPEKIEKNRSIENGKEYFRLPCEYFNSKCTIYTLKRAEICSSFRCNLLKSFQEGKICLNDACIVVSDALIMRASICNDFRMISGSVAVLPFRQILIELGAMQFSESVFDLFKARCNIFEALLIRYFRTEREFKDIMQE